MQIAGIDEAGRGPVIGPMVLAGVMTDEQGIQRLENLGVKDSKKLAPLQRERLFESITDHFRHEITIVTPEEIDQAVGATERNLNWLEADATAAIVIALKPERAIIDCPSNNIAAYTAYLKERVEDVELVIEHQADANHVIAAAGSILAKVTRDAEVRKIRERIGVDFGSGYPSDPLTQDFLKANFDKYPGIFRTSWKSYQKVFNAASQRGLGDF